MGTMILGAAAGTSPLAAASGGSGLGGSYTFLIIIVLLFGLMYFVMIRPQRNRQRQMMQMQRDIMPGVRVRTTAGMYATVTSVEGEDVVLEVAPGVNVRYLRRAIMDVVAGDAGLGGSAMGPSASADGSPDSPENGHSAN